MSTVVSAENRGVSGNVIRAVRSVSVSVPAGRRARAESLAEAERIFGLDLSDEDRAERIRSRRPR